MTTTKKPDVSTPSAAHLRMKPSWERADALLGGTTAMRAAAETYLPRHDKESTKAYDNRLSRTTLLNMYEDTVDTLAGKPFSEPMVLGDDVPPVIVEMCEDIDLQGTAIGPFCQKWFRLGWAKGLSHVLVDYPILTQPLDAAGKPRQRTLDDDRREGARPYWVLVQPENVVAAYAEMVDGRERLTHVRLAQTTVERRGWEEVTVERIKVLEPGTWATYVYDAEKKEWNFEEEGLTGLDKIPFHTFYAGKRLGLMECKPPLDDLGHLNVTHWQSSSDQRNVLTVARFPILAASGYEPPEDGKDVEIGPNKYLTTSEQGKWYYVEHSGAAIEAGAKDLESLENQMASYGAEFLRRKPGGETATARAIDSSQSRSYLDSTVEDFRDCVEEALQMTAEWLKLESGGSVQIGSEEDDTLGPDAPVLDTLTKARAARDLSRPAYLTELKRHGVLNKDFDVEEDADLLADEAPTDGANDMFNKGKGTGAADPVKDDDEKQPAGQKVTLTIGGGD